MDFPIMRLGVGDIGLISSGFSPSAQWNPTTPLQLQASHEQTTHRRQVPTWHRKWRAALWLARPAAGLHLGSLFQPIRGRHGRRFGCESHDRASLAPPHPIGIFVRVVCTLTSSVTGMRQASA